VVTRGGKSIQLNPIGLKLLQQLMESSPSVVTRQDLETRVWGGNCRIRIRCACISTACARPSTSRSTNR
jgi:DNA-binding response OmpR family regulator